MAIKPKRSRARRDDVVFYTPWIGSILSAGELPPGGAETQILLLAKRLARRGVRVAIIVFANDAGPAPPSEVDGVRIVARAPYRQPTGWVGKLMEPFRIWHALWRTPSRTIVNRGVGIELGLIALYGRVAHRRLVFSSANIVDFDYRKLMPKRRDLLLYEVGVRLAAEIIVQTEEQLDLCRAAFGRRSRLIKSISPPAELQSEAPEAFLWIGRLVSYKRPLEYIALARALPECSFWMVGVPMQHHAGGRALEDAVSAGAEELSNLELLAPRAHAEIQKLVSRAVASVNTADFEGMPNVLLEGWSRGVPALVLAHDPGGVVCAHGLGGFADGSAPAFVALAREQWATRHARQPLAQRCRRYVAEHHSPEIVAAQWLDVVR